MFNKDTLNKREGLVIKSLILDEIYVLRNFIEERKYLGQLLYENNPVRLLESIYNSINDENVTDLKKEDKLIVIKLLEKRIEDMEEGFKCSSNNYDETDLDKSIKYLSDLILCEYKLLYNKYVLSILN